ncbi:MAG: META domain-containing protein [Pseudohongiellaceae bacterium]
MKKYNSQFSNLLTSFALMICIVESSLAAEDVNTAPELEGSNWQLVHMTVLGGYEFAPEDPSKYVLNFRSDNRLTGSSDCNELGGLWMQGGMALRFEPFNTSRKLCSPGSLHNNFSLYLRGTKSFSIESGNLVLTTTTPDVRLEFEARN